MGCKGSKVRILSRRPQSLKGSADLSAYPFFLGAYAAHNHGGPTMMDGLIAGRLYGTPEQRIGKAGRPFMVARMRAECGDGENLFVNVIAFDAAPCAALQALHEGDALTI